MLKETLVLTAHHNYGRLCARGTINGKGARGLVYLRTTLASPENQLVP